MELSNNKIDKIKLSIVVPFFNDEKYIKNCIESIFSQDIPTSEYEVIMVNDCSPDKSRDIVIQLQKKFPLLKLIDHDRNKKQGAARNTGLRIAKGDYIWFIDADDYLESNVLRNILDQAFQNDLDVLHFDFIRVFDNGEKENNTNIITTDVMDGNTFFFNMKDLWWKTTIEVWRKIHKRSFLLKNGLYFDDMPYYEDVKFSFEVYNTAKKIQHLPEAPYCYRNNTNSLTNCPYTGSKLIDILSSSIKLYELNFIKNIDKRYIKLVRKLIIFHINKIRNNYQSLNHKEKLIFIYGTRKLPIQNIKRIIRFKDFIFLKYYYILLLMRNNLTFQSNK